MPPGSGKGRLAANWFTLVAGLGIRLVSWSGDAQLEKLILNWEKPVGAHP